MLALRMRRGAPGWVWVELLMVLALVAASLLVAGQVVSPALQRARAQAVMAQLQHDLGRAREEAARRGQWVMLCRLSECLQPARAVRGRPSSGWAAGWRVVLDADADGVQDLGEPVLVERISPAPGLVPGVALLDRRAAGFRYQFSAMGMGVGAASRLGWERPDGTVPAGWQAQVCVSMPGRSRPC